MAIPVCAASSLQWRKQSALCRAPFVTTDEALLSDDKGESLVLNIGHGDHQRETDGLRPFRSRHDSKPNQDISPKHGGSSEIVAGRRRSVLLVPPQNWKNENGRRYCGIQYASLTQDNASKS